MSDFPGDELSAISNEVPDAYATISGEIQELNITETTKKNYELKIKAMSQWIRDTEGMNANGKFDSKIR